MLIRIGQGNKCENDICNHRRKICLYPYFACREGNNAVYIALFGNGVWALISIFCVKFGLYGPLGLGERGSERESLCLALSDDGTVYSLLTFKKFGIAKFAKFHCYPIKLLRPGVSV